METPKMGDLYQRIANQINEIIPSEWENVCLLYTSDAADEG